MRAFCTFLPAASNRGARNVTSSVCHSPGGRHAFTLGGMRMFLDEHKVAKQYWPERLETVAELPRNAVGKVQKFVLRDRLAAVVAEEER